MKLALLAVALAALAGADGVDRGRLLDFARGEVGQKEDNDHDDHGAKGVEIVAETVSEHHVLADRGQEELGEGDAGEKTDDRSDDGDAEVFCQEECTDLSVLDTDGLHDADLTVLFIDGKGEGDLQDHEGKDDQADRQKKYDKGNDHVHDITHGDGGSRLGKRDILASGSGFVHSVYVFGVDAADLSGIRFCNRSGIGESCEVIFVHQYTCVSHKSGTQKSILETAVDDQPDGDIFLTDFQDIPFRQTVLFQEVTGYIAVSGSESRRGVVVFIEEVKSTVFQALHQQDILGFDGTSVALLKRILRTVNDVVHTVGIDFRCAAEHVVQRADGVGPHGDDDIVTDAALFEIIIGSVQNSEDVVQSGPHEHRCQDDKEKNDEVHDFLLLYILFQNT